MYDIVTANKPYETLTKEIKAKLLSIAETDVKIKNERSTLLNAIHFVAASLAKCYETTQRKLVLPSFNTKSEKASNWQLEL